MVRVKIGARPQGRFEIPQKIGGQSPTGKWPPERQKTSEELVRPGQPTRKGESNQGQPRHATGVSLPQGKPVRELAQNKLGTWKESRQPITRPVYTNEDQYRVVER